MSHVFFSIISIARNLKKVSFMAVHGLRGFFNKVTEI